MVANSKIRRLLVAALLVTAAGSAAANVLVVRASGPSARAYPPGKSLPDNARIVLRANDTLVILGAGGTRTFRGPGTFSPSSAVRAGTRTTTASDGRRARIGAVRSAGLVPQSPTIWDVDVTQSGTFCVLSSSSVLLWRPDATDPIRLNVTAPGGGQRTLDWPAGQPTLAWPAGTELVAGQAYSFRTPGVAVPVQIIFRTLTTAPANLQEVAAALIENGCQEQLDLLVESAPDQPTG